MLVGVTGAGCSSGGAPADEPPTPASASSSTTEDAASDVATTEPGSELDLGDEATVAWRPAPDLEGVLDLSVDRVRAARMRDFAGLVASGSSVEGARPYYVDVRVTNAGESDLGGLAVPLYLRDTSESLGPPWGFEEPFRPCRSRPLPASFAPGQSVERCLVFFARAGAAYDAMAFQPTPDVEPITWDGDVTDAVGERRDRPSRRGR